MAKNGYAWRFFRAGGLDQVLLENAEDLRHLRELDNKLWVALACPVKGTEIDQRTLKLLDGDNDGRVRVPEIVKAVEWASVRLKNPADLLAPPAELSLDDVDDSKAEGKAIIASARMLLDALGRPGDRTVSIAELSDHQKLIAKTAFNGDGVIVPESSPEPAIQAAIKDIQTVQGSVEDRCGKPGVDKPRVEAFCAALDDFAHWSELGDRVAAELHLGGRAVQGYAALNAVRAKIDDWFVRCRLAAYDARYQSVISARDEDLKALFAADLSKPEERLANLPLAQVAAGAALPLRDALNPAWAARMETFRAEVVAPLLGADVRTLEEGQWRALVVRFAAFDAWSSAKKGAVVEKLGIARVRELIQLDVRGKVLALIARDVASGPDIVGFEAVERLARLRRDLGELLHNFVNFSVFYGRRDSACFQAGTLYLDSRAFDLCVRVEDPSAHAALALNGRIYLAYCKCTRPSGEYMHIAAAVTQGDNDYLSVGRNGIFYDRLGRDWDATIVKIIDNPISIRQAFWSPYKKVVRLVQEQIEKLAAAREKSVHEASAGGISAASTALEAPPPAAAAAKKEPFDIARFAGVFAAIGLALGAIGGAVSGIFAKFMELAWWQMPLAIIGLILVVSGPSVVIAWLKLRQRTLGPVLEGIGWAVNGRVALTIPLATALTGMKQVPVGALRALKDPYAEQKRGTRWLAIAVIVTALVAGGLLWQFVIKPWLNPEATSVKVKVEQTGAPGAPATKVTTEVKAPAEAAPPAAPAPVK